MKQAKCKKTTTKVALNSVAPCHLIVLTEWNLENPNLERMFYNKEPSIQNARFADKTLLLVIALECGPH